jgi:hypothetical protein
MRSLKPYLRWWPALRSLSVALAVACGVLVLPMAANAGLDLVLPPGPLSGSVNVALDAPLESGSVAFEWSPDQGTSWFPIAVDSSGGDGFTAVWETTGFTGTALVRAIVASGEVREMRVEIDNVVPALTLSVKRPRFSPNGDGRRDSVGLRARTNEGGGSP